MKNQEFKVGDRVWSLVFGWGVINDIKSGVGSTYPVVVDFDSGKRETFTEQKFYRISDKNPSLFHANQGKIEFDTNEPIELVVDQPIWVLIASKWMPRHVARQPKEGGVYCYRDGKSKHSSGGGVKYWKYFRTTDPALDGESDD